MQAVNLLRASLPAQTHPRSSPLIKRPRQLSARFRQEQRTQIECEASTMTQAQPFTADDNWANVMPPTSGDGYIGYVGKWGRYTGDGSKIREYSGVRMFRINAEGESYQVNIYGMQTPGSEERKQDGGFEKRWQYNKAEHSKPDGWWHPFMVADGPMRGRALAASRGWTASVCCALPLPDYVKQHERPPPFVGGELFFRAPNETRSWSGGPLFATDSGALQTILFIREYWIEGIDPEQPFPLDRREVLEPRGMLAASPAEWLQGGGWRGACEQLVWDAGGSISRIPEQPADWAPPPVEHKITLLPDLFYVAYPESIPTSADAIPAGGVSMEMGGRASDNAFRRIIITYGSDGRIACIRYEEFTRA